jgi:hypothetical protein
MLYSHDHQRRKNVVRWSRTVGCACRPVGRQRRPQQTCWEDALVPSRPFPRLELFDRSDVDTHHDHPPRIRSRASPSHPVTAQPNTHNTAHLTMVPKPQGSAIQSATHRPLPPLPKLRVRRPNKPEANPCLSVMASVLGAYNVCFGG